MKATLFILSSIILISCNQINIESEIKTGKRQYEADSISEAIETFSQVINNTDTCQVCFETRGFSYKSKGLLDEALRDFSSLIELDESNAVSYANRGSIYYLKGDYENSLLDFKKAYDLDGENNSILVNPICHMLFATGQKDEACIFYHKSIGLGELDFDETIVKFCEKDSTTANSH